MVKRKKEWTTVSVNKELADSIEKVICETKMGFNKSSFIATAIREKLEKLIKEAALI